MEQMLIELALQRGLRDYVYKNTRTGEGIAAIDGV
jgi:hypothetical protein